MNADLILFLALNPTFSARITHDGPAVESRGFVVTLTDIDGREISGCGVRLDDAIEVLLVRCELAGLDMPELEG